MNVLYIDHYAGSESMGMEFRPFYLSKIWKDMDINTTILAADYSHLRKTNPIVKRDLEVQKIDGTDFLFLKTTHYHGNGLGRIKSMFDFVTKGILKGNKIIDIAKPDVVITSSTYPLDTYIGQRIAKKTGAKLFHEIHDLWPLSPMELGGFSKNHPFIKIMQYAEDSAYKNSDGVISILPNTKPYIRGRGYNLPVYNIPNGLLGKYFSDSESDVYNLQAKVLVGKLQNEGKFIVGYSGGISVSNAMDDFINAMMKLKGTNISAVIIGDGILKKELIKIKEEKHLDNVFFIDKINKNEVIGTLKLMDALYIGSKKSMLYSYGVSANKIFDYLLAGKPIINAFDTEHSPMNYVGNTIIAEAENSDSIAEAIIKSSNLSDLTRREIEIDSRNYVYKNHNYDYLADRFATILRTSRG